MQSLSVNKQFTRETFTVHAFADVSLKSSRIPPQFMSKSLPPEPPTLLFFMVEPDMGPVCHAAAS